MGEVVVVVQRQRTGRPLASSSWEDNLSLSRLKNKTELTWVWQRGTLVSPAISLLVSLGLWLLHVTSKLAMRPSIDFRVAHTSAAMNSNASFGQRGQKGSQPCPQAEGEVA